MQVKRATIYQVAERAGVSHQTVSRYLRHKGGLKPGTLARVEAAISELNYRPNRIARSMRTRQTNRLAILLPSATTYLPLRLLAAATATAHDEGYTVDLVGLEGGSAERAERAHDLAESGEVEGVLALASLGEEAAGPMPASIVIVAGFDDALRGLGQLADGAVCGEVVRHLAALGHRSFLHLAGDLGFTSARNRRQTFTDTVAELGLTGVVVDAGWSAGAAYEAVLDLPDDSDVTAVVAANDKLAMGAVRACLRRGWQVPGDVSVFGWDDAELGRFATPALSTVRIDLERQGREAMRRLIALVRDEEPPALSTGSLHTILPRESSGPAPARRAGGRSS